MGHDHRRAREQCDVVAFLQGNDGGGAGCTGRVEEISQILSENEEMDRKIHFNRTSNAQIRSPRTHDIQKSGLKPHFGAIQPEFWICQNFWKFQKFKKNQNKFKIVNLGALDTISSNHFSH